MFQCFLPKTNFGYGAYGSLGEIASGLGTKAFLAIDPYLHSNGLGDSIGSILKEAGVDQVVWSDIQPNPCCTGVDRAAVLARYEKCDLVIAVGGGSALDFGKGVAIVAANPGNCWDYTERGDHAVLRPGKGTLPVLAVPATAGTGSEATPFAVFNNPGIKEKSTIVSDRIFPTAVVIDPELMLSMPPRLTASTGFDAFAHALESYISLKANPFTRMVAREAIQQIIRYLPEAVANGTNRKAREKLAWASMLAGASIANIGVTLPHALGQPVSGLCGASHGESIAACMGYILEMSWMSDMDSFGEIAELFDPSLAGLPLRKKAEGCPRLVRQFLKDIGLQVRFSDFGLTEGDIEKVTRIALVGYYFDISCHPGKVSEEEIRQIYLKCL